MPSDSGTDLTQLEYEFATNPSSEAFIPLAEAYLEKGRYVEAMVVCKKGIKAHPDLPTGRLIMARIYSDQAKHQKAIGELDNLLKLSPQNGDAFRLLGFIHLKLGRDDEGIGYLKKALDANPDDGEAREELLKRGVDYQRPPPAVGEPISERPTQRDMDKVRPLDELTTQEVVVPQARRPPRRPAPPQRKRIADIFQEMEEKSKKPERKGIKYTVILGGILLVGLGIYVIYTWQAGLKQERINNNLEEGRIKFNRDTYAGYKAALENYRSIYLEDKEHAEALSRCAFIGAVLTGEYDEDRSYLEEGERHLREAMILEQTSTMHTAAQALAIVYGGGSSNEAVKLLEKALKAQPESAILHTTIGLVLLNKGDLGESKEHLLKGAKQAETRALVGLGEYATRRSLYREATQFFNRGLQSDRGHLRSLLGLVTVSLVRGTEKVHADLASKKLGVFDSELGKEASAKEKRHARFLGLVLKARDRKQRRSALAEIEALLKKETGNALFHFAAAREYRRYRKLKKAKEMIQRALRVDSTRPDFVLEEAAIFLAMKDYESARARALRVQRMDSESGQSMLLAGDAYMGEKNWDKAREYYEKCRDFDDSEAVSHYKLAKLFLSMPKPDRDQAQAELELAVNSLAQLGMRRLAAESAVMLAKIYIEKQRPQEFFAIVKRAMNLDNSYAPPYALIAINQDLKTDEGKESARENCTKNLELDPRNEYAETCRKLLKQIR